MANPQHIEWLLEGVDAWNARRKAEHFAPDFSGADVGELIKNSGNFGSRRRLIPLVGCNFENAIFYEASLRGADLSRARFLVANLKRADFTGSRLTRANFAHSDLRDSCLASVDIGRANFQSADLTGADLDRANLTGADFDRANLTGVSLPRANLAGENFQRANLTGADLEEANLTGADLGGANLTGVRFRDADLTGANLERANFAKAILWGVKFNGTKLVDANLVGADLWLARLENAILDVINSTYQIKTIPDTVRSVKDLLDSVKHLKENFGIGPDEMVYFRGEAKCCYKLRPSVKRDNNLAASEGAMLTEIISRRPEEFIGQGPAITQWVLAQHHGLKTRFLDVSSNPLVALFHACKDDDEQTNPTDGRLYIFVTPMRMVKPFNSDTISVIANFAKLSQQDQNVLMGLYVNVKEPSTAYSAAIDRLVQLIQSEKPYFAARIDPKDFYRVFIVEPQQSSERIRAQSGAFLVSAAQERFERDEIHRHHEGISLYAQYTLTIPGESKANIIEELRLLNITNETLFPGLDSSAAAITERYRQQGSS